MRMEFKKTLLATALLACCGVSMAQAPGPSQQATLQAPAGSALPNPQSVGQPAPISSAQQAQLAAQAQAQAAVQPGAPRSLPPLPSQSPGQVAAPAPATFEDILSGALGMTAEQIRELRRQADARQRAASEFPRTPPKPVTTQISASTAPGSAPPVVRLFPGFASSIVVTDSTGQPWPIENFAVGHKDNFDVRRLDAGNGSVLSVVPLGYQAQSNLILYLKGLATPIAVSFIAGQKEVDFRADLRVQGRGPNSLISVTGLPESTNTQLLSLLEGIAPSDAKSLRSSTPEVKAWLGKNGRMFLRTHLSVISPLWYGSVRSADGTNAYEMKPAGTVLVMKNDKIEQINVEGW